MSSFWDGFEKQALLWSKGKNVGKFFNLANRLAENRAKNMGIAIKTHMSPTAVHRFLAKKEGVKLKSPEGTKFLERSADAIGVASSPLDKTVVIPKSMSHVNNPGEKLAPETRPSLLHHELDEASVADKHRITPFKLNMRRKWEGLKAFGRAAKQRSLEPVVRHAYDPKLLTPKGYHSHLSPDVLLRESNRVFHEAPPAAKKDVLKMRLNSGELADVRRHGLRYGDEYIPEGGRRWNKLKKKMEGTMPPSQYPSLADMMYKKK